MKLEDKQTAIEWLFKQLWEEPKDKLTWWAIFDEAMAIEKHQIIDAYNSGQQIHLFDWAEKFYDDNYAN